MSNFTQKLIEKLFDSQFNEHNDNYDFLRFGPLKRAVTYQSIIIKIRKHIQKYRLHSSFVINRSSYSALHNWLEFEPELEWVYSNLEDLDSKQLLINLIAYRIMGHKAVKLPLNKTAYWKIIKKLDRLQDQSDYIDINFNNWKLYLCDLTKIGFPVHMYIRSSGILNQFLLQQYTCPRGGVNIEEGYVILDCGAYSGDTALSFAHRIGPTGRIYSFEFVQSNLEIFNRNLSLNPHLSERIEVINQPLWCLSEIPMFIADYGPASNVGFEPINSNNTSTVKTISIDDFINERKPGRVDLIKMDIEGAELEALKGGKETICKFRPNLALSIYHKPEHFFQLAKFIDSLKLGYCFYLSHFTIHSEETVLFAKAK
jgi:FkbM family methyltransferase